MKVILAVLAVFFVATEAFNYENEWSKYKLKHGKAYKNTVEETRRFNIWKNHLALVSAHNNEAKMGKHTYYMGMNKFADMTNDEFKALYTGFNRTMLSERKFEPEYTFQADPSINVPDFINYTALGYVTEVGDQEQCGSCWAFTATAALEGQHFKKTGQLVTLSVQNLMDCSGNFGNMGCSGGLMDQAFAYIKANNGIDTDASYPYTATDGTCKFDPANVGATDTGFVDIAPNEEALKQAVASIGPISAAIDGSRISFQLYESGVYYEPACDSRYVDHSFTVVGYGSFGADQDYWIVKNSWGKQWGMQGYVLMSRNRNDNCGISTVCSYPTV